MDGSIWPAVIAAIAMPNIRIGKGCEADMWSSTI